MALRAVLLCMVERKRELDVRGKFLRDIIVVSGELGLGEHPRYFDVRGVAVKKKFQGLRLERMKANSPWPFPSGA